jgi:hypothetical protein
MPYNPPNDGDVLDETLLLNDVWDQVIAQVTSGTRPAGTEGQVIYETDTGRYMAYNGSGWVQSGGLAASALNSYTTTIDQGASTNIAKTTNYSQYQIMGNLCYWSFSITINASGTAGSNFTLTTPVTMTTTSTGLGAGRIWDNSAPFAYHGLWIPASTTSMRLFVDTNISNSAWGVAPNLAIAANDVIHGQAWLPIA